MTIHDTFLTDIPQLVRGDSISVISHMTFSSDDIQPAISDNTLAGETLPRIALQQTTVDGNLITWRATRNSTVPPFGGTFLNVEAVFTASTGGNMWASALLSSLLHTTSFDLEIRHTVTFDREV